MLLKISENVILNTEYLNHIVFDLDRNLVIYSSEYYYDESKESSEFRVEENIDHDHLNNLMGFIKSNRRFQEINFLEKPENRYVFINIDNVVNINKETIDPCIPRQTGKSSYTYMCVQFKHSKIRDLHRFLIFEETSLEDFLVDYNVYQLNHWERF